MYRFRWIFIAFLFFQNLVASAQETGWDLNGIISDRETRQPVGQVSIKVLNSKQGTVSNKDGTFSLLLLTVPEEVTLLITHLGYEPLQLKIKHGQTFIRIELTPKITVLSEVEVAAGKKLQPEKVSTGSVLDYELLGEEIYILGWQPGTKNPVLKVVNQANDSVLKSFELPFYTENLYRDCVDNLHLLTEKLAYGLKIDSAKLGLYPPQSLVEFSTTIKPCAAAISNGFYLTHTLSKTSGRAFYYAILPENKPKLFCLIQDVEVMAMQKDEGRHQKNRAVAGMNRSLHSAARNREFAQKVLFREPYIPLFRVGEKAVIFNHIQGAISFYQRDSLVHEVSIYYPQRKDWAEEIIIDPVREQAYGKFEKNGITVLEEIDLVTGETGKAFKVAFPFAHKFRITDGRLYFLYRDLSRQSREFLYAARLTEL